MQLSVIVCTYNRAHAVIPCLDSIAASLAQAAPVDAEIVVVDNASTDNTSEIVREWAKSCAFPVDLQFERKKGANCARNCGVRASKGGLLIFTDDDCRLDKDHISAALRHDAKDGDELVLRGGRVELGDPTDLPMTIKRSLAPVRCNRRLNKTEGLAGCLFSCNMAMRRALIDQVGFFDERFGPGTKLMASDDIDYIYRAYHSDCTVAYAPDMVIFHHHGRKSPADGYKLERDYTIAAGALYMKYLFHKEPKPWRIYKWQMIKVVKEIVSGKNYYRPEIDFSYKDLAFFWGIGAFRYILGSMKRAA